LKFTNKTENIFIYLFRLLPSFIDSLKPRAHYSISSFILSLGIHYITNYNSTPSFSYNTNQKDDTANKYWNWNYGEYFTWQIWEKNKED